MAWLNALNPSLPPDVRLMNATTALLLGVAAIGLASMAVMWVVRQPLFVVRSISVEGELARNSVSTLRANTAARLSGNFFTMDLAEGRRAFESVPWVRQAVVNRIWPNRLAVRLEEHRVAALWATRQRRRQAGQHLRRDLRGQPGRRGRRQRCPP